MANKRFHYYAQQSTKVLVEPLEVKRRVKDGDLVKAAGVKFQVMATPGNTRGPVIHNRNTHELGDCINEVHEAQQALFPCYVSHETQDLISKAKEEVLGVKLAGAGGFGYIIQVAENPPDHAIRISSRRPEK